MLGSVKYDVQVWVPVIKMVLLRAQGGGVGLEQVKESLEMVLLIFEISVGTVFHEQLEMSPEELEIRSSRETSWLAL